MRKRFHQLFDVGVEPRVEEPFEVSECWPLIVLSKNPVNGFEQIQMAF
jgi:hypothetical protein